MNRLEELTGRGPQSPDRVLRFVFDIPPSTNKLYQRRRGGQVALTNSAQVYRRHIRSVIADSMVAVQRLPRTEEDVYGIAIGVFFESLENPGWFETFHRGMREGERKAKTRYKIIDSDNRVKFLKDSVSIALGIPNDCQFFIDLSAKFEDKDNPRAEVLVWVEDETNYLKGGKGWQNVLKWARNSPS